MNTCLTAYIAHVSGSALMAIARRCLLQVGHSAVDVADAVRASPQDDGRAGGKLSDDPQLPAAVVLCRSNQTCARLPTQPIPDVARHRFPHFTYA